MYVAFMIFFSVILFCNRRHLLSNQKRNNKSMLFLIVRYYQLLASGTIDSATDICAYPYIHDYPFTTITLVLGRDFSDKQSTAHQITHFGLCAALISKPLALISNYKCIS
jgi:hypothetical protein